MPQDETESPSRTGAVAWAMRIVAVSVLVGCGATQYHARAVSTSADPAQVASRADYRDPNLRDPETTGSIAGAARSVALDPCALRLTGR
ncbi:hypothetical protein [Methylobacterium soli]|uniref:Uncharacterized protein n=1 Tax=Methylobacterium soli TaxID=553447 RepID=A0A6L3T5E1_9HYPH|nr:hypothetical protein [Methylobacterium soli]KAB1080433.1 hypothetical protein F6X53_07005 [Methylobacterium soli]